MHISEIKPAEAVLDIRLRGTEYVAIGPVVEVDGKDRYLIGTDESGRYDGNLELSPDQAQDLYHKLGKHLGQQPPGQATLLQFAYRKVLDAVEDNRNITVPGLIDRLVLLWDEARRAEGAL